MAAIDYVGIGNQIAHQAHAGLIMEQQRRLNVYEGQMEKLITNVNDMLGLITTLTHRVNAMWDAPGMPGANAVLEDFENEKR